jgi:MscS family membrane protein
MRVVPRRVRSVVILLAAALVLPALAQEATDPEPPPAPASGPRLDSPRDTFDVFLSAMVDVKRGDTSRLADAVACLDLSRVPTNVRTEAGRSFAQDLKNYLDKIELIDVATLPEDVAERHWVWRRSSAGEVSLDRGDDGRWRFSDLTRTSLPALLESVEERGFVAGIEGGGGAGGSLADLLRSRLPRAGTKRGFLLENWQWIALLVLAFIGVVVDRLVRLVLGSWTRRLLQKSERLRDRKALLDFAKPIGILAMAVFWILVLPLLDLELRALAALKFAAQLLIAASGVWAAYRLVDLLAAHFLAMAAETDTKIDDILIPMARRALKIVVVAFGLLFVAQNLDIDITSLLAGLGIGGIAFALAAKDTVENLFGSVTVLVDRPFQIGDWVVIDDLEGTVEEIGFRSTRIRTFYNSRITVPNARLVQAAVDNLGLRTYRRIKCMISLEYGTSPEKIEAFCEGVRELIRRHPYTRKDFYMVYFNEFADSALNLLLYAFLVTPDWATELREKHRLFVDIVRLAKRLGVEFAFPTQTLHVASTPRDLAFARPEGAAGSLTAASVEEGEKRPAGDPVHLGRAEAQAILEDAWGGEGTQPPVDFANPESISSGRLS